MNMCCNKLFILVFLLISFKLFSNYENTVHYVWMGDINTTQRMELATLGPDRLDFLIRNLPIENEIIINFWVREPTKEIATQLFTGTNIKVRSIDDYLSGLIASEFFNTQEIAQLKKIIDEMEPKKFYAFQKDIIGIFLVAELGGYLFDTTTYFYSLPNLFNNDSIKRIGIPFGKDSENNIEILKNFFPSISLWNELDLQISAAPIRGDAVFILSMKKILASYNKHGLQKVSPPHFLISLSFEKEFGIQPHNFTELIFRKDPKTKTFSDLKLLKISAGTWRYGSEIGSVTGEIHLGVMEKIHNLHRFR